MLQLLLLGLLLWSTHAFPMETITGRLALSLDEDPYNRRPAFSMLLEPTVAGPNAEDAQPFLELVGLGDLPQGSPPLTSGAFVAIAGHRLPREDTLQEQFVVLEVLAVRPSRRKALQSVVAQESPERNSNPAPVPGKGLKVLVMRPRLPDNCPYDYPVGVGGKEDWKELINKVSFLQSSCTDGQLTYDTPVVTEYLDIPCILPNNTGCDRSTQERWYAAAKAKVEGELKIDTDEFDHVICDFPVEEGCNVDGWGLFYTNIVGFNGWVVLDSYGGNLLDPGNVLTIAHELGHNYGLTHANRIDLGVGGVPQEGWQDSYGTDDESSLMGYGGVLSCFSLPAYARLHMATPSQYSPDNLPAGTNVAVPLRTLWQPDFQGALFRTGLPGQEDWRIWASYMVTTSSGFTWNGSSIMRNWLMDNSVVMYLTSTDTPLNTTSISQIHRAWVMQSGDVFRWDAAGLVFKYVDTDANFTQANLLVCRETAQKKCNLETTLPVIAGQYRISPVGNFSSNYCLQTCTEDSCQPPSPPYHPSLRNVYFAPDCPQDNSTAWTYRRHISGAGLLQNIATGKCLTFKRGMKFLVADAESPLERTYSTAVQHCNELEPPSFRDDKQLFMVSTISTEDTNVVRMLPVTYFPDCPDCEMDVQQCMSVLPDPSPFLPSPANGSDFFMAGTTVCGLKDVLSQTLRFSRV